MYIYAHGDMRKYIKIQIYTKHTRTYTDGHTNTHTRALSPCQHPRLVVVQIALAFSRGRPSALDEVESNVLSFFNGRTRLPRFSMMVVSCVVICLCDRPLCSHSLRGRPVLTDRLPNSLPLLVVVPQTQPPSKGSFGCVVHRGPSTRSFSAI